MIRVGIVQRVLPHYRVPFFDALHERLAGNDIALEVFYGQHVPGAVPATTNVTRPWSTRIRNHYLTLRRRELVWQSCLAQTRPCALVIVEQASRLLTNYPLLARRRWTSTQVAFWGHGRNFQAASTTAVAERFKLGMTRYPDWWFAYTQSSGDVVERAGYPGERVSVVQNTIDTSALAADLAAVTADQTEALRASWSIRGERVGLFVGSLREDKRFEFLFAAAQKLHADDAGFELVIVGDGPCRAMVEAFAADHDWVHYVGPAFGRELAGWLRLADVMLMPGLVGLVIIDAMLAGLPLVTTSAPIHSPEIDYLQHGRNGLMTDDNLEAYTDQTRRLMADQAGLRRLAAACVATSTELTLERMVERFSAGVVACLARGSVR